MKCQICDQTLFENGRFHVCPPAEPGKTDAASVCVDSVVSQQDSLDEVAPHYSYFSDKHKGWVVVNRYELNGILAGPYKIKEQALHEAARRNSLAG